MNLNDLNLLKSRFGNNRNFNDLIDTLAAVNKPPLSAALPGIPFVASGGGIGTQVVPHTLGAAPSTVQVSLQCNSSLGNLGYSQNELVSVGNVFTPVSQTIDAVTFSYYLPALTTSRDASNVYILQSVNPSNLYIQSKSATPVLSAIDPTKWNYYVYASLDYIVTQSSDPQIILQPASQIIGSGAATNFVVGATGTPTLTYQWQVSTNSGASWAAASGGVYSGNTTNTLSISNVSSPTNLNGYQYRCLVTNGVSNSVISNVVALTVNS